MNADVFEAVCAMGDAARTAQSQLAQANTEAKNQLLNAIADLCQRLARAGLGFVAKGHYRRRAGMNPHFVFNRRTPGIVT